MYWLGNTFSSIWIDSKGKTAKKMAKYKNQSEFFNIYSELAEEALGRYQIDGLPDTVNERVVLEALLFYGCVCFFVKEGQVLALPGMPSGGFTLYGDPIKCIVYGRNGYTQDVSLYIPNGDDSELVRQSVGGTTVPKDGTGCFVRENKLMYPFLNYTISFAERIADSYRALDVVRQNMKRPFVVVCEDSVVNSVKSFFNKRDENEEFIISSGVFPSDKVSLLPLAVAPSEDVKASTQNIEWLYSQYRKLEGFSENSQIDKAAQISIEELNRDKDVSYSKGNNVVDYLNDQLKFVNEKLGTNMSVKSRTKEEDNYVSADNSDDKVQSVGE